MGAVLVVGAIGCALFCGRGGPPPDTKGPTIVGCPGDIRKINDPVQTHARATWTPPEYALDDRDGKIYNLRSYGGLPGWAFNEHRTKVGYTARDRAGNMGSCHFFIDVEVVRCSLPPSIPNGYYICHPSADPRYGTTCRYGCYRGFTLHGDVTTKCTKNKNWSAIGQSCEKVTCDPLQPIEHGSFTCTDVNRFQSKCSYSCDEGYDIKPGMTRVRTCAYNKRWIGQTPLCIDFERPKLLNCPVSMLAFTDRSKQTSVVTWVPPTVTDNSWVGAKSNAMQIEGPSPGSEFPVGTTNIAYTAYDNRGNRAQPCHFQVYVRRLTCPTLYTNNNLRVQCPDGYGYGAACNFSCVGSNQLVGTEIVTCDRTSTHIADWQWGATARPPTCEGSPCPDLIPGDNSALACDNWLYGRFCKMACKSGYDVGRFGVTKLTTMFVCKDSGVWDSRDTDLRLPACTQLRKGRAALAAEIHYFSGDCCDNGTQQAIKQQFIKVWKNTGYGGTCLNDPDRCHAGNVIVKCGPSCSGRRRRAVDDFITTLEVEIVVEAEQAESSSAEQSYNRGTYLLNEASSSIPQMNISSPDLPFNLGFKEIEISQIRVKCNEGYIPASYGCVGCNVGEMMAASGECIRCPRHTYQDEEGQLTCKSCPPLTGTQQDGVRSPDSCIDLCAPGTWSDIGVVPCSPCAQGFYTADHGSVDCQQCPRATTTPAEGAVSLQDCTPYDLSFTISSESQAILQKANVTEFNQFTLSAKIKSSSVLREDTPLLSVHVTSETQGQAHLDLITWTAESNGSLKISAFSQCDLKLPLTEVDLTSGEWYRLAVTWSQAGTTSASLKVYNKGDLVITRTCSLTGSLNFTDKPRLEMVIGSSQFVGLVSDVNLWNSTVDQAAVTDMSMCSDGSEGSLFSWHDVPILATLNMVSLQTPSLCDDTDECELGECQNGAECVDLLRDYQCLCTVGFTGTDCEENIDDCAHNECGNNSTCVDGINSYTCDCTPAFKGDYCDVDIVSGGWSDWGDWSICSRSCGGGTQSRERLCNNPPPDPDGQPCDGVTSQTQPCNEQPCPFCSTLDPPDHGKLDCVDGGSGTLNCTLSCDKGYEFAEEPLDHYWCGPDTGHVWSFQTSDNPDAQLPDCTAIALPNKLRFVHRMEYPTMPCDPDAIRALGKLLVGKSNELKCVRDNTCRLEQPLVKGCHNNVDDDDDKGVKSKRSTMVTGELPVYVSDDSQDKNLTQIVQEDGEELEQLEGKVGGLIGAAEALDIATKDGQFTLDYGGNTYYVRNHDLSGQVECPFGMTYVKYYCVPCGAGHFKNPEDLCERCPVGSYQSGLVAERCVACPFGTTTPGRGSKYITDCTLPATGSPIDYSQTSSKTMDDDLQPRRKPETENAGMSLIIMVVAIPVAMILIVVMTAVIIYKCRAGKRKDISPNSTFTANRSEEVQRPTTARGIDLDFGEANKGSAPATTSFTIAQTTGTGRTNPNISDILMEANAEMNSSPVETEIDSPREAWVAEERKACGPFSSPQVAPLYKNEDDKDEDWLRRPFTLSQVSPLY